MLDEQRAIVELGVRCYSEAYDSKLEQTRVSNPFPSGGRYIDNPDAVYHDAYLGDLWKYMGWQPAWKSRPVNNMVMPAVENYVTFITDNDPSPSIMPREDGDIFLASIMRGAVDYWWDAESMQMKVTQAVRASSMASGGLAWLHTPFEDRQKCEVVLNESILCDPECTVENFDPSYVIYEYRTSLSSLKAAYPKAEWDEFRDGWTPTRTNLVERVQTRFKQVMDTSIKSPIRTVSVYELWIKDTSKEEFTEEFDDKVIRRAKTKYPNGWRVITLSGGIVVCDKPSPYKHGQAPFSPVFAYQIPGRLQGMGHVQALLPMQIQHMRANQIYLDATVKAGGAMIFVGAAMELDAEKITNAPVQIHNVRDPSAINVVEFPAPPRHLSQYIDKVEAMARDAVGQHDISVGKGMTGNTTAQEINAISANDKTRVRSISRGLSWSLERMLRQVVSNLAQFEDTTWFLRIAGDDGNEESVAFQPTKMLRKLDESGSITEDIIEFDLKIDDQSMLPNSANELMQQALNLFDRQAMSKETLMKTLKVSNPRQEIERINAEQAELQKQAMEAQAAQAPPDEGAEQMDDEAAPDMGAVPVDGVDTADPTTGISGEMMAQIEAAAAEAGVPPEMVIEAMQAEQGGGV